MSYIPDAISVVIPTYNRAHLIKASIQSVLDQTLQPYEIIVVDDFSTDNTEEVVNSFNSPLIKYVKNQRKKGANGARNTGILMAKGEFIAFHDSDDTWYGEKLKEQYNILRNNEDIYLCFCSLESFDVLDKKIAIIPKKYAATDKIDKILKQKNIISTQTILLRNELENNQLFDEDIKRFQDWDFILCILKNNKKIFHLNKVLVKQKINESSISVSNNFLSNYWILVQKHPFLKRNGIFAQQLYYKTSFNEQKNIKNFALYFFTTIIAKFYSKIFY